METLILADVLGTLWFVVLVAVGCGGFGYVMGHKYPMKTLADKFSK